MILCSVVPHGEYTVTLANCEVPVHVPSALAMVLAHATRRTPLDSVSVIVIYISPSKGAHACGVNLVGPMACAYECRHACMEILTAARKISNIFPKAENSRF